MHYYRANKYALSTPYLISAPYLFLPPHLLPVHVLTVDKVLTCNTHTHLTALCPGLPRLSGTRKVKPIWILLKQETLSGSGISWAICKSAPRSRQITTPAPHYSVFYRPNALPAAKRTCSFERGLSQTFTYVIIIM